MMNTQQENWYVIDNIRELDSPALVIYPERVMHNIRTAIGMVGDVSRLRPHVKTNKSPEATGLMIDAGISKFKCATIAEADMLGNCQAKDVLLAYQPVGPKLKRFAALIGAYPSTVYACLADNLAAAQEMDAFFAAEGLTVPVYIDLNIGQNRTGIMPGKTALDLYIACAGMKGIKPVGLHAYDGHIRDVYFELRKKKCDLAFLQVEQLRVDIIKNGLPAPVIIAGGSPTFSIHCNRKNVECSPGTFIYWDKGYSDLCPEQDFVPAALVITRVVSLPSATTCCLDLGHKSIAPESEIGKRVFFLNAPELKAVGQSEEHLVAETGEAHDHIIGEVLYGLPFHICPTVALYERAVLVQNHEAGGEWKNTARDRRINI